MNDDVTMNIYVDMHLYKLPFTGLFLILKHMYIHTCMAFCS